jgi:hypothetical protein
LKLGADYDVDMEANKGGVGGFFLFQRQGYRESKIKIQNNMNGRKRRKRKKIEQWMIRGCTPRKISN